MNGLLKRQIQMDKSTWLKGLAGSGSWEDIKKLRHPRRPPQGRLQNSAGVLVNSDDRADTLALHLQNVQWAVRPCGLIKSFSSLFSFFLFLASRILQLSLY